MPLEEIFVGGLKGVDLSALRGMKLTSIGFTATGCANLRFLADAPLKYLQAENDRISDLSPLRGKPLERVILSGNDLTDLSPLRGAPIIDLLINGNSGIKDLTPLLDLPKLEKLRLSRLGKLLEPLRHHPSLKFIAYDDELYRPAAEFWADYDAQQQAGEK